MAQIATQLSFGDRFQDISWPLKLEGFVTRL